MNANPQPTQQLVVRKILPCPPDYAFAVWTDPEQIELWMKPAPGMQTRGVLDVRVGGKYRLSYLPAEQTHWMHVDGEFLVVDRPHRLQYTWVGDPETMAWLQNVTVVTVEFNALANDKTELVLTHARFIDDEQVQEHTSGWCRALESLEVYARTHWKN